MWDGLGLEGHGEKCVINQIQDEVEGREKVSTCVSFRGGG